MVDLVVQRPPGLRVGPDIEDPLISETSVALERGRNELDATATAKVPEQVEAVYRPGVVLGQLVEVEDVILARTRRGKVTAIRHVIANSRATSALTVERVTDFGET